MSFVWLPSSLPIMGRNSSLEYQRGKGTTPSSTFWSQRTASSTISPNSWTRTRECWCPGASGFRSANATLSTLWMSWREEQSALFVGKGEKWRNKGSSRRKSIEELKRWDRHYRLAWLRVSWANWSLWRRRVKAAGTCLLRDDEEGVGAKGNND